MKKILFWMSIATLSVGIISCSGQDVNPDDALKGGTYNVSGKVEKGPFISGSTISIQPMDAKMQILGGVYNAFINDDFGNFALGTKDFEASFAELLATGYFFNEVTGQLSNGTIALRALVDLNDNSTVNVNVLTHLKYQRIKNLVASGKNFTEANSQAQNELFTAFGLDGLSDKDASSFSISSGTDESAALILVSSILAVDRSEAELTEYLSKLSFDFGDDGIFSDELKVIMNADRIKVGTQLNSIRNNIVDRYASLGINVAIKDLSHFMDWNGDGIAGNEILKDTDAVILDKTLIEVPNTGGDFIVKINSPVQLYTKPQVSVRPNDDFATTESLNSLYDPSFQQTYIRYVFDIQGSELSVRVSALDSRSDKTASINLYDYIGNVVATIRLEQKGNPDLSACQIPLLGRHGQAVVCGIAENLTAGISTFNRLEQNYNSNKTTGYVDREINSKNTDVFWAWSELYKAMSELQMLSKADAGQLAVYKDYCNVLNAIVYTTLVYGWGGVPYFPEYIAHDEAIRASRTSPETIFADLKSKLSIVIEHLEEKENMSMKDANGLFFVSADVARVILADIYMYEGNWIAASSLLEKVVSNGFYSLDPNLESFTSTDIATGCNNIKQSKEIIYALVKFYQTKAVSTLIASPEFIPYITLSDVYLSLAECNYHTGNVSSAMKYMRMVSNVKNISVSGENMIVDIKNIREKVLLHSGKYFAFLKRNGIAQEVCGIKEYQLLFPIHDNELFSNSSMTQNPGYGPDKK